MLEEQKAQPASYDDLVNETIAFCWKGCGCGCRTCNTVSVDDRGKFIERDLRRRGPVSGVRTQMECVTTVWRSEEHTSELQSLMRISYAVYILTYKRQYKTTTQIIIK